MIRCPYVLYFPAYCGRNTYPYTVRSLIIWRLQIACVAFVVGPYTKGRVKHTYVAPPPRYLWYCGLPAIVGGMARSITGRAGHLIIEALNAKVPMGNSSWNSSCMRFQAKSCVAANYLHLA